MQIPRGIQKIGEYKNISLLVDFDDLFKYRGGRGERIKLERSLGALIFVVGVALLIIPIIHLFMTGGLSIQTLLVPIRIISLLPYFSIFCFLYALFLNRDRSVFDVNHEGLDFQRAIKNLKAMEIEKLEVDNYFSERVKNAIDDAFFVGSDNFLLNLATYVLSDITNQKILRTRLGTDVDKLNKLVKKHMNEFNINFRDNYISFFIKCFNEASRLDSEKIGTTVLLFIFNKYYWKKVLIEMGVSELELQGLEIWFRDETRRQKYYRLWERLSKLKPKGAMNRSYTSRATPTLDKFSEDYTAVAAQGHFQISVGKDDVALDTFRILQKESGSSVLMLGEPGVGKTHFLRYLATRMVVEDVPKTLQDYRMVVVDLNSVLTRTSSIDKFKQTLQEMLTEISLSGNVVLVLEELAQILNIRSEGRFEIVNLLANIINKSKLKIIATTDLSSYNKQIKPIKQLSSLFNTVTIPEPTGSLALQILIDETPSLEKKYGIEIQVGALKRIVEFAPKIEHERVMPDKGINLLEEAIVTASDQGLNFVSTNIVDNLLSEKVGVKVGLISDEESSILQNLEDKMHERVIDQVEAIKAVSSALRRARSGLAGESRPLASFLFFGPTGVGKTEVAKTLAETYYGDEKLMIRLDMSEYHEESNLNRLIGYTDSEGNFVGGYLTEAVRSKPFSLILLDELEKANPKVLDIFLQVLDEGKMKDGMGREINFTNSIIIATSNAGSREIADLISGGEKYYDVQKEVMPILRQVFRVEFLNRFDKVIMFKPLKKFEVEKIADLMLNKVKENLQYKGLDLEWDRQTLTDLAELGYDPIYGARELRRVIQDEIEDNIANLIISKELVSGRTAVFSGLEVKNIK